MSYRVEFHKTALVQLNGFPSDALDALISRVADLVDAPWDAMPLYPTEPEYRQATFGPFGLVSFYVDETAEVLRIFDVTWTG